MGLIRRRGAVAVLLGRWTASLRAFVPSLAGVSGLPYGRFAVVNVCGGVTWAVAVAALGYLAGEGYRTLERRLGSGELALAIGGLLLIAVFAIRAHRRQRRLTVARDGPKYGGESFTAHLSDRQERASGGNSAG